MSKSWGSLTKRNGSWTLRYSDPHSGRRVRKTIGPCEGTGTLTKKEAADEVTALHARLIEGRPGTTRVTLRGFLETWLPLYRKRVSAGYARASEHGLECAGEYFGKMPMSNIRLPDAEVYVAKLADRLAPATVHTHVSYLCACWNAAREREVVVENPWSFARKLAPKVELRVVYVLSVDERELLVNAVPERSRPAAALIDQMGMRRSEATNLIWDDYRRPHLTIRKTKTHKPRTMRLTAVALEVCDRIRGDALGRDSMFGISPRDLSSDFKAAVDETGLSIRGLHDLRHNVATRAAMGGATTYEIAKLLGNTPIICERYMDHAPNVGADRAVAALESLKPTPKHP